MSGQDHRVSIGFTGETFPAGTHMCLIYDDDRQRQELISSFLGAGIAAGEKVAYFADTTSVEDVEAWLLETAVELLGDDRSERFAATRAQETYCPDGRFLPDRMLETLRDFDRTIREEGFTGGRVSGEMSWALRGLPGSDRLPEYEALVNDVLEEHPITAICQYDAGRFDGGTLFDILKVHPMMIVGGQVVRNPYYVRPEEFLRQKGSH
jgi:hypothetical protein